VVYLVPISTTNPCFQFRKERRLLIEVRAQFLILRDEQAGNRK